jgi:hypothetical protein
MELVKEPSVPVLKYKTLNDQNFINALRNLVNFKTDDFKVGYKLSKILDKVDSQSEIAQKAWVAVGSKLEWEDVEGGDRKPKDPSAYQKAENDFLEIECDFGNCRKVAITELLGYKFSAVEIKALAPILDGLEELDKE